MAFELKEGQFTLHKNTRKEKKEHPDLVGQIMVQGELRKCAAWLKISANNHKWYSGQVNEPAPFQPDPEGPDLDPFDI